MSFTVNTIQTPDKREEGSMYLFWEFLREVSLSLFGAACIALSVWCFYLVLVGAGIETITKNGGF